MENFSARRSSISFTFIDVADRPSIADRKFCDALFRHAPDPTDPLSPFSTETHSIRERAIEHLKIAMDGSNMKFPADLEPKLPFLLWLYQMGLILFWLCDRSPNQERTAKLTEKSLNLLVNLLRISSLPLMKPVRKMVLEIVDVAVPQDRVSAGSQNWGE